MRRTDIEWNSAMTDAKLPDMTIKSLRTTMLRVPWPDTPWLKGHAFGDARRDPDAAYAVCLRPVGHVQGAQDEVVAGRRLVVGAPRGRRAERSHRAPREPLRALRALHRRELGQQHRERLQELKASMREGAKIGLDLRGLRDSADSVMAAARPRHSSAWPACRSEITRPARAPSARPCPL